MLRSGINCTGVGLEEDEDIAVFNDRMNNRSKYVVLMDPLDGSGNVDFNVSIGTIFSVYKRVTAQGSIATKEDFLQPGNRRIAAGYIIYRPSTILVYATQKGVSGFTLDSAIGEFCPSHKGIQYSSDGRMISVNVGNRADSNPGLNRFSEWSEEGGIGKNCSSHLSIYLFYGSGCTSEFVERGVYNPSTTLKPDGKLRLLYECSPLAFIVETAGDCLLETWM